VHWRLAASSAKEGCFGAWHHRRLQWLAKDMPADRLLVVSVVAGPAVAEGGALPGTRRTASMFKAARSSRGAQGDRASLARKPWRARRCVRPSLVPVLQWRLPWSVSTAT